MHGLGRCWRFPTMGSGLGREYRCAVSNFSPAGESGDGQNSVMPMITVTLILTSHIVTIDQPVDDSASLMSLHLFDNVILFLDNRGRATCIMLIVKSDSPPS